MKSDNLLSNKKKALSKQGFFFVIIGACAALVHFLTLIVLVQYFNLLPEFANVLAFLFAFSISFIGHFRVTFYLRDVKRSWWKSLWRWFMSSLLGFSLNQALFMLGLLSFGQKYYPLIWLAVTVLVTLCTFSLAKLWAFSHIEKKNE